MKRKKNDEMKSYLAIIGLVVICIVCLMKNIDGVVLGTVMSILGAIAGYHVRQNYEIKARRK